MRDVVVVEAVRTPGRAAQRRALGHALRRPARPRCSARVVERSGIDPTEVGQVVGGCVGQVGMQAANVTRTAWLQAGLPLEAAATTVNTQCGSSQQATNMATALVAAGVVDVAVACGVEVMSAVPMGSTVPKDPFVGQADQQALLGALREHVAVRGRRAHRRDVRRHPRRARRVRQAVAGPRRGRVGRGPLRHADRARSRRRRATRTARRTARTRSTRDEGLRDTTLEALANLKPVLDRDPAFHTAGTASQISDGAGALLLMTAEKADALGLDAEGTHRRHVHPGQRPGAHAHRPDPRHRAPARAQQAHHRRHRPGGDQRGVRVGRARLAARHRRRHGRGSTPTAAPSRSVTRSAAPAPSCSPRPSTSSSAPGSTARSSRCAAVAASAPAPSSNASDCSIRGSRVDSRP